MSETNVPSPPTNDTDVSSEGGLHPPPGLSRSGRIWWWFHFLVLVKVARLRFVAVLLAIGAFIVYWDTLKSYYDWFTRPAATHAAAEPGVEWFCPMHPQIIRDNPKDKCPICFMPLSKRAKGQISSDPLPAGTISRVQLSPYRVTLAGVRTYEVGYQQLSKDVNTVGTVEFDERRLSRVTVRPPGKSRIDKLYVNVTGQAIEPGDPLALIYSPELTTTAQNLIDAQRASNADLERIAADRLRLWGIDEKQIDEIRKSRKPVTQLTVRSPVAGRIYRKYQVEGEYVDEGARLYDVVDVSSVWIEAQVYEEHIGLLREGLSVHATTVAFPGREFIGRVTLIQPHLDPATRTVRVRFDIDNPQLELRPGMYASVNLKVPITGLNLFTRNAAEKWSLNLAAESALPPSGFTGMASALFSITDQARLHSGLVLAIPEGAVIDTGNRKIVYREVEPGTYDGVEVRLGPRCGELYPVAGGLALGDRVVATGSFLIDAETRLNPAAGSIYVGGSSGSKSTQSTATHKPSADSEEKEIREALAELDPADQKLAQAQRYCPVLGSRLGSMGKPAKVLLQGRTVFLCCSGCEDRASKDPAKTLARVDELLSGQKPNGAQP